MSQTQNHHHQTTPAPQQPPVTPQYYSDTFSNIINNEYYDDQYEQQQLISDLLSSSASTCSSPSETTTSFPYQQVKFVSYPYFLPCFESSCSSSYITINGNEETCGSSFSDADSSVMASFDTTASFHISHAFSISGLLQNDDDDYDFFSGNDVTMLKSRDLGGVDEDEEDGVWDWSVFLRQDPTTPTH